MNPLLGTGLEGIFTKRTRSTQWGSPKAADINLAKAKSPMRYVDKTVPMQYVDFFIQAMRNQQSRGVGASATSSATIRDAYGIVGLLNDDATALTYVGTANN